MGVRPEHIECGGEGVSGRVLACDYLGAETVIEVGVGSQKLMVRVPGRLTPAIGDTLPIGFSTEDVHLFDGVEGRRMEVSL